MTKPQQASDLKTLTLQTVGKTRVFADHSGKVRDTWLVDSNTRIIVTSDRLSALDRIVGLVTHKGQVLNQLAAWWFEHTADICENHLIKVIDPQAIAAKTAQVIPVEVVVRARLTGSTSTSILPKYLQGEREIYGHELPDGLQAHGLLPHPIITPTTKAQANEHDQPTTIEAVATSGVVDAKVWQRTQQIALQLFERGAQVASQAGFILADTKYEFGLIEGEVVLVDEIHTPDSSRFWAIDQAEEAIRKGQAPAGFDKEPVRLALRAAHFNGDGEIPQLADSVWQDTSARYIELFEALTGTAFVPAERPIEERIQTNIEAYLAEKNRSI